jgi:hypothetical protein
VTAMGTASLTTRQIAGHILQQKLNGGKEKEVAYNEIQLAIKIGRENRRKE